MNIPEACLAEAVATAGAILVRMHQVYTSDDICILQRRHTILTAIILLNAASAV